MINNSVVRDALTSNYSTVWEDIQQMYHYTYITTHNNGKYYVGRHSTSDINDKYIGSGKWVKSIKDKDDLSKTILNYYKSFGELMQAEKELILENINNPRCMNFNNNPVGFASGNLNWARSPEAKLIKSKRKKGLSLEAEHGTEKAKLIRQKISDSRTGIKTNKPAWNRGSTPTDITKSRISESINNWMSTLSESERKEKFGNPGEKNGFFNKTHSESTIAHLKEKQKLLRQNNRLTCPHCSKNIDKPNYTRYHGDNCKLK